MLKCLLWGTGEVFRDNVNLVKIHELYRRFSVVGITSATRIYSEYEGYQYIPKEDITDVEFDFVVVMAKGDAFKEILDEAASVGIIQEQIYPYKVLSYSSFDIERYRKLRKDTPSIFSNNCWGGLTYHSLGLTFHSPLVNVHESDEDYIRLVSNPREYMEKKLELIDMGEEGQIKYPICRCGDIALHFNHTTSFEAAKAGWERRKRRINWNNLLVEMFTENKDIAEAFARLPYEKKICFVPFKTDKPSLVYLEFHDMDGMKDIPLWKIVNGMATGAYPYYDVFTLLETGNIEKICRFREC